VSPESDICSAVPDAGEILLTFTSEAIILLPNYLLLFEYL
jgi:hypothetical protein